MRQVGFFLVIALLVAACGGGVATTTDPPPRPSTTTTSEPGVGDEQLGALAAARQRWDAAAPADYTVTQQDRCDGCSQEPQTVAVREGEVVSLASSETETIEDVFTTIEQSLRDGADVDVEYHPEFGYPVRLVIDLDGDGTPDIDLEFGELEAMPIVETLEELLAAKQLWDAQELDAYTFIFRADCTCPDGGTFEVEVERGRVAVVRPLDAAAETSELNPGPLDAAFDDLAEWFTDSSDLIGEGLLAIDVRMDPDFGYPRWFRVEGTGIGDGDFADDFTLIVTVDLIADSEPIEVDPDSAPIATDMGELNAARERWDDAALADYAFVMTQHCECDSSTSGPFDITVRGGEVFGAVHRDEGFDATDRVGTVDELFESIEAAILGGIDVDVTYDPALGFPTLVIIDPEAVAVDGGLALSITEFETGE